MSTKFLWRFLSRRGKIIDVEKGISDVDSFDATGMAHTGFIIRTGFSGENQYMTLNLVRQVRSDGDTSQLRAWSLEQFFIGSGEKDAMLMIPEKRKQIALWNALLKDMTLEPTEVTIGDQTVMRQVVTGGLFTKYHVEAYNLLSDYAFDQTQNCNEHLAKTLTAVIHDKRTQGQVSLNMEMNFKAYEFRLSKFKKWMANKMMGPQHHQR